MSRRQRERWAIRALGLGLLSLPAAALLGWFGLLAPVATPKELIAKLSADSNRVLADAELRSRMLALGADPAGNTPAEFARFIRGDQAKWAKLMREAGIKPEGS